MCYTSTSLQNAAARTVIKLIVLLYQLYHYNSNNLKFYSTTNEPQQKASADDENGAAQLLDNGFQMSAVMVEELDAPEGLGSFGPIYGFGDAPFGAGANKPTTTAESHSPPSSSTVDGVEEDDYAGNTSTSMDK